MMRVLTIEPRDIVFVVEISVSDMKKVRDALNVVQVKGDVEDADRHVNALNEFYSVLDEYIKGAENGS